MLNIRRKCAKVYETNIDWQDVANESMEYIYCSKCAHMLAKGKQNLWFWMRNCNKISNFYNWKG